MWRRFLFRTLWVVSVAVPTIVVGLVVLFFLGDALEPVTQDALRLVFGGAALMLTLAALALSATRAHDERAEAYGLALAYARIKFRISGVILLQSGYLLSIGTALLYAARFLSEREKGILEAGSTVMDAVGLIGNLTATAGAGIGWVGCWWLAKALWTSQHELWLPPRSPGSHPGDAASQGGQN